MIEKAADFSLLQIGRRYFNLRLEKLSDDWHSFVNTIEEQEKNVLTIVNRSPEILQTDIYQILISHTKEECRETIYILEREKRIRREKTGNTYKLSPHP